MKPSARLKLIRSIAEKLSEEEWNIIDLTLEQFSIGTSRGSRADPIAFISRQIAKTPADLLLDLAHHLEIANDGNETKGAFWREGYVRLFISHLAKKKETASALRDELELAGISAFVAHSDISPSKEWLLEIELALQSCDALVALMEAGFHKSLWTDHEVGFALGRKIPILPVNMGESPYGFLAKFQACKFHDVEKLSDTIFKLLLHDQRTAKKLSYAIVTRFEQSVSFAAASQNLKWLKKIRYWDESLVDRVKAAVRKNDQIKGSFDVPEGVQKLLKKVKVSWKG